MKHPSQSVFSAIISGTISKLWDYPQASLSPFLPLICTAVFHSSQDADSSLPWEHFRKALHSLLLGIKAVNHIKKYLLLDFSELEKDGCKELQLMKKLSPREPSSRDDSMLLKIKDGLVTEFEKSSEEKKFRLVLSELLRLIQQVDTPFQLCQSDLFECNLFLEEVGHIISIAVRELPILLPINKLAEALLRVNNGSYFLCCLLANMPEVFNKVLKSLVLNGESLDEISLAGRLRSRCIQDLVIMYPSQASYVQWLAFTNQKLPTLMIFVALDNDSSIEQTQVMDPHRIGGGVLSLMNDIVIHGSDEMKTWFAQYMKLMQQKYRRHRDSAVTALRKYLMKRLLYYINYNHQTAYTTDNQSIEMEVELEVGMVGEGVEEEEEKMDTLTMELVDQMEIEISEVDHDDKVETKNRRDLNVMKSALPHSREVPHSKERHHRRRHSSSVVFDHIVFTNISVSDQFTDDLIEELTQLLHVLCGLKIQAHMYLTGDEISAILRLITSTCPPFSSAGVIFVKLALSVLLACPFLISTEEGEVATVRWLQWLIEYLPEFEKVCPGQSCYGEMLLLVAMHLQDKQLEQIGKLIRSVLGMRISGTLKSGNFSTMKTLFLKVFNESVVCSHAVSVTPTPNVNGNMTGYLPIHCIHQLIQSKAFRKHGVSVKEWIYKQLCCVDEPLHSLLPSLIEEYVQAILVTHSNSSRTKSTNMLAQVPFTAEEVLYVFDTTHTHASEILMLYYVLYYHDCLLANLIKRPSGVPFKEGVILKKQNTSLARAYSPNVMLQLPVKRLLQYASVNQASFLTLYPSLLRLIITHFPHLCLTEDWIKQEQLADGAIFKPIVRIPTKNVTLEYARNVLLQLDTKSSLSLLVLSHLSSLSPSSLLPYCSTITVCFPLLLGDSVCKPIIESFCSLWTKLNSVVPRRLWVETINAVRPVIQHSHPPYTYQNLVEDPLIVLQCDSRIFRCPNVFYIILRILAACTAASRVWLSEHAHMQNCLTEPEDTTDHDMTPEEREELRIALTAAQESAIIQLLLEICLPSQKDRKEVVFYGSQLTPLREIHCLVGSYLHQAGLHVSKKHINEYRDLTKQHLRCFRNASFAKLIYGDLQGFSTVFIAEPSMVKLVHFQGYPIQLLPMVVSGVPSIHIAMDFISELLSQPDKQVFAIQLAANVTAQYPLPDAMGVAQSIFKKLNYLVVEVPSSKRDITFKPILIAVVILCETFPPFCSEAIVFLLNLCKICFSTDGRLISTGLDSMQIKVNSTGQQHLLNKVIEPTISNDPVYGMEDKMEYLNRLTLTEGACWTFHQIVKLVALPVSGK